jgi:tetratricopeptide (TPR) repeat protein
MAIREKILEEVKSLLHGPIIPEKKDYELTINPLDFFTTGILFPQVKDHEEPNDETGDFTEDKQNREVESDNSEPESSAEPFSERKRKADENNGEDELELVTKFRPSVASMSFLVKRSGKYSVRAFYVYYTTRTENENGWNKIYYKRNEFEKTLDITIKDDSIEIEGTDHKENHVEKPLHTAFLSVTRRKYVLQDNVDILTVSLINKNSVMSFRQQKKTSDCIFEIAIEAHARNIPFQELEDNSLLDSMDNKDLNIKLLYRNYKKYCIGHGISVNWDKDAKVQKVWTEVIPVVKVDGVELDRKIFESSEILFMKSLCGESYLGTSSWKDRKEKLIEFVNEYGKWIKEKSDQLESDAKIPELLKEQGRANLKSCGNLKQRMLDGINTLESNTKARQAFEDGNAAMFIQRVLADFSKHRQKSSRVLSNNDSVDDALPDFNIIPSDSPEQVIWNNGQYVNAGLSGSPLARWRPFQLAFLLSQVNGIVYPEHQDRETVDLIWFPTGGGKTEAYLGLIAFTIFWRRLKHENNYGAGVSVLMRYTLRLLNKQQFERASILITACEIIRQLKKEYGTTRITNGIWVGGEMTPNTQDIQIDSYRKYLRNIDTGKQPDESESLTPPLLSCPCCGNRLIKEIKDGHVQGRWGYFRIKNRRKLETGPYLIACTNTKCYFHTSDYNFISEKTLPVYEVDEHIYQERPSLLFATADKLVSLAWNSNCVNLFNIDMSQNEPQRVHAPPELILQDELHLISSALGTIYGVFEFVIDRLCMEKGHKPKVVGATATVREPELQCQRLYGRDSFMQFPPPGIDADDSFYAVKKTNDEFARMYVGFMPSGVTSSTALIRLTSVLLERITLMKYQNNEIDSYYSLVIYFNALKELGKFRTFLSDDIVAYRKILANYFNVAVKTYDHSRLNELSSVMNSDQITKALDKLEKTTLPNNSRLEVGLKDYLYSIGIRNLKDFQISANRGKFITNKTFFAKYNLTFKEGNTTETNKENYDTAVNFLKASGLEEIDPAHVVPATSMISVGVDIGRLNTMIINGQPKTTSEYIQASSRIGRKQQGVVFTFLAPTKNRDRSHYEQFKDYHQAYYKYVESSSVTPEAEQALEKMFPTVLVALLKSLCPRNLSKQEIMVNIDNFAQEFYSRFPNNRRVEEIVLAVSSNVKGTITELEGTRSFAVYGDFFTFQNNHRSPTTNNHYKVWNCPANLSHLLPLHIPTVTTLRNVEQNCKVEIK